MTPYVAAALEWITQEYPKPTQKMVPPSLEVNTGS